MHKRQEVRSGAADLVNREKAVRHTEFWTRMDSALGSSYARTWSREHVVAELAGRTVLQALDAGESPKAVWRAVWQTLGLPATER